jgi:hypothetical protein
MWGLSFLAAARVTERASAEDGWTAAALRSMRTCQSQGLPEMSRDLLIRTRACTILRAPTRMPGLGGTISAGGEISAEDIGQQ